uniref:Uncharacterized protein n=1 Tax=Physcomitrium patens TaxID=3218 RepID=A0A7I4AFN1_PHYPA
MRRRISAANQGAATPPGVEIGSASRNWYTKVLIEHPIKTKAITLGILNCVGDIFTQLYVEKSGGLDYRRVASMTTFGLFIVGPTLHYWYSFLNRVVKASGPKGVAIRLVLDQVFLLSNSDLQISCESRVRSHCTTVDIAATQLCPSLRKGNIRLRC